MIIEACGCSYAGLKVPKSVLNNDSFCFNNYCNLTLLQEQAECYTSFMNKLDMNVSCTECSQPACERWEYSVHKTSFSSEPGSSSFERFVKANVADQNHTLIRDAEAIYGDIHSTPINFAFDNIIQVRISFISNMFTLAIAEPLIQSQFALFSNIGGSFGFWLGFSILTVMEVLEFFVRLLVSLFTIKKVTRVEDISK